MPAGVGAVVLLGKVPRAAVAELEQALVAAAHYQDRRARRHDRLDDRSQALAELSWLETVADRERRPAVRARVTFRDRLGDALLKVADA